MPLHVVNFLVSIFVKCETHRWGEFFRVEAENLKIVAV